MILNIRGVVTWKKDNTVLLFSVELMMLGCEMKHGVLLKNLA